MPDATDRQEEPLLTASTLLKWRAQGNAPVPRLPEAAIITHQRSLLPRLPPWKRGGSLACFSFDARLLSRGAVVLAAVRGVGAPATAIAIEELAAAGVRQLIAIDVGGSIDARLPTGGVVLVDRGLACDGTSPHYAAERAVRPDEGLTARLGDGLGASGIACTTGGVWSTDAVYREMPSQRQDARRERAVLVDMETACVFAVGGALGLQTAAVLLAADELHDDWTPPADTGAIQAQLRALLEAATACLVS